MAGKAERRRQKNMRRGAARSPPAEASRRPGPGLTWSWRSGERGIQVARRWQIACTAHAIADNPLHRELDVRSCRNADIDVLSESSQSGWNSRGSTRKEEAVRYR